MILASPSEKYPKMEAFEPLNLKGSKNTTNSISEFPKIFIKGYNGPLKMDFLYTWTMFFFKMTIW